MLICKTRAVRRSKGMLVTDCLFALALIATPLNRTPAGEPGVQFAPPQ